MSDFCTLQDVIDLFRPLNATEQTKVTALIPLVCDALRQYGDRVGMDLDAKIAESTEYASVAKLVTVDIISRILRQEKDGEPMSQFSQTALGYTISGSPVMAGGGIGAAILNNDLKRLGIKRQRYGALDLYAGND